MVPWAHLSPQSKQCLDQFSHFCRAHSTVSSGMPRHVLFPKNCTFALGNLDPHLIHESLRPPESKSQMASGSVQLFLYGSQQRVAILNNGPPFPLKIDPSTGSGPLSNTWFVRPIWGHNPKGISIGSTVFAQLTAQCSKTFQWAAHSVATFYRCGGYICNHLM